MILHIQVKQPMESLITAITKLLHGKLKSNSSSKTVSVAEINNGNRTFVFDGSIELQTVIVTMPLFRFPLIGK